MTSVSTNLPFFTAEEVERLLPFDRAMDALEAGLRDSVDPEVDGPRLFSPAPRGEFLLMPAQGERFSGLKALTVAPENPARGLEKIQGLYILLSSDTLGPIAVMEGSSLTAIRTPAVTVSAIRQLAAIAPEGDELPDAPQVLIFGAGVQGVAHIRAMAVAFPNAQFEVAGRRPERVTALVEQLQAHDITVTPVDSSEPNAIDAAVASADIIICASSTSTPLFNGSLVKGSAIVAATGTHGLDLREIDDVLVERADIVVEGRGSAQRENGNLVSLGADVWQGPTPPPNLRDLARGQVTRTAGRPAFYTGVGMSWEDLVCATTVFTAASTEPPQ